MSRGSVFRADINGLRAYAVLSVMLFHFRIPGFGGGFIGVDIFFVISGFLMTKILVGDVYIAEQRCKVRWLLHFYLNRAKRIVPALIALCVSLLIAGWFLFLSYDLRKLASQIVAALTFLSNIKFWGDGDGEYFDASSQYKLLLHTWSLSVEWQFYLLYPLVLLLIWRFFQSDRIRFLVITAILASSFTFSAVITLTKPAFAFYLLPTRAWELLAGALVFLGPTLHLKPNISRVVEAGGFFLILASIFLFDDKTAWPGYLAIVPVLGSALILLAARQGSLWIRPPVIQALGYWSYSAYLWHWPLAVALMYMEQASNLQFSLPTLALSILLGWASYIWIEGPAQRYLSRLKPTYAVLSISIAILGVVLSALVIHRMNGVPQRAMLFMLNQFDASFHPRRDECKSMGNNFVRCIYGEGEVGVILIGDSHAGSVVTALQLALPRGNSAAVFSFPGCTTLFDKLAVSPCSRFNAKILELLSSSFNPGVPLIIANKLDDSKSGYIENIVSSACLAAKNRPVYLMRPMPEMPLDVPSTAAYRSLLGKSFDDLSLSLADYHQRHRLVWKAQNQAEQCGVRTLNPLLFLCDKDKCNGIHNGQPLYYDANHLSEYGNHLLTPMFRQVFGEADRKP